MGRIAISAAAVTVLLLAVAGPASAATLAVNTEADNGAASGECSGAAGDCSIRQALHAAADGDTIAIPAGHYTLVAAQQALVVDVDVTIEGFGAPVVDGDGATRVFAIGRPWESLPAVTMSGVTVTGGQGGIAVYGQLTLERSTVRDSHAAANGGGIALARTAGTPSARITDSTVSGNTAGQYGGGVYNDRGVVALVNSTVSGNGAGSAGGGIYSRGDFFDSRPSLFLSSSTIAGNEALGPDGRGGNVFAERSFLTKTATGDETAVLRNTIVAEGTAAGGANCGGDPATSLGHNLVPGGGCGFDPGAGDVADPARLGPLADNGGPTFTRGLLGGSPAIDGGDPDGCSDDSGTALAADQRGVVRPRGARCDIGAVEHAPPAAVTGDADGISRTSAVVHGVAGNPHVAGGSAYFEVRGTTKTAVSAVSAGAVEEGVAASLDGLEPATTYHYRLVVENRDGVDFGEEMTFTTEGPPREPEREPDEPQPDPEPEPDPAQPEPHVPQAQPDAPHSPAPRSPRIRLAASTRCVSGRFGARVSVYVFRTATLRRVDVMLDGRRIRRTTRRRFGLRIGMARMRPGAHVLRIEARDSGGRTGSLRRLVRRCRPPAAPPFTG